MSKGFSFAGFPVLKIHTNNVSGDWNDWLTEFDLAIRMKNLEMGYEVTTNGSGDQVKISKFTEEAKLLVLLKSIGMEGRGTLISSGLNINGDEITYDKALEVLVNHYQREDSLYVRTQKFISVNQCADENYRDYMQRVERLSRTLDFFTSITKTSHDALQGARESLALALCVTGLRDQHLRNELMADEELTWEKLGRLLRCKSSALNSSEKLGTNFDTLSCKNDVSEGHNEVYRVDRVYESSSDGIRHGFRDQSSNISCFDSNMEGHRARDRVLGSTNWRERSESPQINYKISGSSQRRYNRYPTPGPRKSNNIFNRSVSPRYRTQFVENCAHQSIHNNTD